MTDYKTLLSKDKIYHFINTAKDNNPDFGKVLSDSFTFLFKDIGMHALICFFLFVTSFLPFLTPFIMGGWFIYIHKKKQEKYASFSDVFLGFQHGGLFLLYLVQMLVYTIITIVIVAIGYACYEMMGGINDEDIFTIFFLIGFLAILPFYYLLQVLFFFSTFFVLFSDMTAIEAMKASFDIAKKKFGKILLVVFVAGMIAGLGTNLCYIGLLFTYPFGFITYYIYFEKFFKLDEVTEDDEIDDILEHLV